MQRSKAEIIYSLPVKITMVAPITVEVWTGGMT